MAFPRALHQESYRPAFGRHLRVELVQPSSADDLAEAGAVQPHTPDVLDVPSASFGREHDPMTVRREGGSPRAAARQVPIGRDVEQVRSVGVHHLDVTAPSLPVHLEHDLGSIWRPLRSLDAHIQVREP